MYLASVAKQIDYYLFGMIMDQRSTSTAGYRYGYNGKENEDDVKGEGNQQDYGLRIYDPRVARFLSVDPLAPDYPWYTLYQFAGNAPVWALDLDGLEELIYLFRLDLKRSMLQLITTADVRPVENRNQKPTTIRYQ